MEIIDFGWPWRSLLTSTQPQLGFLLLYAAIWCIHVMNEYLCDLGIVDYWITGTLFPLLLTESSYCVQIKKGIFRLGRGDGKEDLICPIDPSRENRQRTHVNGAILCNYEDSPQEVDEVCSPSSATVIVWCMYFTHAGWTQVLECP